VEQFSYEWILLNLDLLERTMPADLTIDRAISSKTPLFLPAPAHAG
jgi:hypothetical protein